MSPLAPRHELELFPVINLIIDDSVIPKDVFSSDTPSPSPPSPSPPSHNIHPTRPRPAINLNLPTKLLLGLLGAYTMANLLNRLMRPFTTSTLHFAPETPSAPMSLPEGAQRATIAAGCFWGVEHMYRHDFGASDKGLLDARVGYIGGDTKDPSYRAVCSGRTGHAEACQLIYDPQKVSYRTLLEYFYKMHDPTTSNRQGPDVGSQYRSGIFYHDEEQKKVAEEVTRKANEQWWKGGIVTEILPAGEWWDAEKYHQLYLQNNPGGYECPSHFLRKFPDLQ